MVQCGGSLGLDLESLKVASIERACERENLEGDAALERDLVGLVDDAHAAPADFAQQLVVAQAAEPGDGIGYRIALLRLTMR